MSDGITPFVGRSRNMKFRVPQHIQSDFDDFLMTDIPHVNYTYEIYPDWYNKARKAEARGEVVPINWKSKYAGSDSATNVRMSLKTTVNKGDILIRKQTVQDDALTFMAIWDTEKEINNKRVQIQKCNMNMRIVRMTAPELDPRTGQTLSVGGEVVVVDSIPAIGAVIVNKLEYSFGQNLPGILPNHMIVFYIQWNNSTKNIRVNDEFIWHGDRYKIIDVNKSEVTVDEVYGLVTLTADKVAGGGT